MHVNLTKIRELLSGEACNSLHRYVFILSGNKTWQKNSLTEILRGYEKDALWVAEQEPITESDITTIPYIETSKAVRWLGKERRVVVFDANKAFNPDSFAAISGVVVGGGIFFILMPVEAQWDSIYSTCFGSRLTKSLLAEKYFVLITESTQSINIFTEEKNTAKAKEITSPYLSVDQMNAVITIKEQVILSSNNHIVLTSDRGRGKSAALGLAAARLFEYGLKNIAVTAPRLSSTEIIFKHIQIALPDAAVSRGLATWGDCRIQFYSPDQLGLENITADVLLIDEAAAIPVPILSHFLDKFPKCVFATTVHGYEGTGRGFSLRFRKVIAKKNPGWIQLRMQTPIRWLEGDPLEKWMFKLLCLDADIYNILSQTKIKHDKTNTLGIDKNKLSANENLLKEVFALLVLAHYRTRPNDLRKLLDDDNINIYVTFYNGHVIAAALVIAEGRFSESLSRDVYRGKRRPAGNLLAQAITYHCGIENAATLSYARVMRIVVHPEIQGQGIGSALLEYIIRQEKNTGRDAIGASFGMTEEILKFWYKPGFHVVRIGFTREQTSGEHAAIMLLPLTNKGENINAEAMLRFNKQWPYWSVDILKDIPAGIAAHFNAESNTSLALTEFEEKDLQSFSNHYRNYELCIAALNKLVALKHDNISHHEFPESYRDIVSYKINSKLGWKEIVQKMKLNGQAEAREYFNKAICLLMDKHN